jgi:uncharacterized membrane protein YqjE
VATPGTPSSPDRFSVPGSGSAAIPLVTEPEVERSASLGTLVKQATEQVSTLVRSEIELAKLEITQSLKTGVTGGVFFGLAAAIGVFSLFFFFFMVGEILSIWLWRWLAFTIVFLIMVVLAAICGLLGLRKVKQVRKPEKTIAQLNQTATTLKIAATHSPETPTQGTIHAPTVRR